MFKIIYKDFFFSNFFLRKKINLKIYNKFNFILPNFLNSVVYLYNGKNLISIFINKNKIGYKFKKFLNLLNKVDFKNKEFNLK